MTEILLKPINIIGIYAAKFFQQKSLRDAFLLYVGRGLTFFVGTVSTLIYGIIFSKDQIAIIGLVEMIVKLFISFGFTWSAIGIVRFGKEEYLNAKSINNTSSTRLTIVFPLLLISVSSLIIFKRSILSYIDINDNIIIIYLIFNVIFLIIDEHLRSIFQAAEMHYVNVLYDLSYSIGRITILAVIFNGILEAKAIVFVKLNVFLVFVLVGSRFFFVKKNFFLPLKKIKLDELKIFLKFVSPQIVGFVALYLINWMDIYFIRLYCNLDELGAYQFLYSIFVKLSSFAIIMNTLFFPKIISWRMNNPNEVEKYLRLAPYFVFLILMASISIFCLSYESLFSIFFKNKYQVAYPAFNILMWAIPLYFLTYIFVPVLNSYDKVMFIQTTNIISALLNLIIDFIMIKYFGIIAAAIGTFIAYHAKNIILTLKVRKIFRAKYGVLLIMNEVMFVLVIIYFLKMIK